MFVVGIMELPRQLPLRRIASTKENHSRPFEPVRARLVGALGLHVAGLLALVANLLASSGLLRAVAGVVTRLATVVALHAVDALAFTMVST